MIFRSNMDSTLYSDLGVTGVISGSVPTNGFFEANSPKPAIAKRSLVAGKDTFFCNFAKAATLRADGWNVTAPQFKGVLPASANARAITRYVTTSGLKYAWNEPTFKLLTPAQRTAFGVEEAQDSDRLTLIWGATFPRPAMVTTVVDITGATGPANSIRSFIDDSKISSLPANTFLTKSKHTGALHLG